MWYLVYSNLLIPRGDSWWLSCLTFQCMQEFSGSDVEDVDDAIYSSTGDVSAIRTL